MSTVQTGIPHIKPPARKMAAKSTRSRKAKSKVQRARISAKKSAAKKKQPLSTVERRPMVEIPIETTIIDIVEEPAPGVMAVTEYESIQMTASISAGDEPEGREAIGPAETSTDEGERREQETEERRDALME